MADPPVAAVTVVVADAECVVISHPQMASASASALHALRCLDGVGPFANIRLPVDVPIEAGAPVQNPPLRESIAAGATGVGGRVRSE